MQKVAKLGLLLLCSVLLGMQFVPATKEASAVSGPQVHMASLVDPQVGAILERSCADCHSSSTKWPWYSRVAPVSWMISKHVNEGREMLDFSEWINQPPPDDQRALICDAVSDGRMPLPSYTMIHHDAKLSKSDVQTVCNWANAVNPTTAAQKTGDSNNRRQ